MMDKAYDPKAHEERLYRWWDENGYFRPETQVKLGQAAADAGARPFVISMPPPNVTGALHMGHALTAAMEDLMIRYHRMQGEPTLWVPGTDHAGIATQNVGGARCCERGRHQPRRSWGAKPSSRKVVGVEAHSPRAASSRAARRLGATLRLEPRAIHARRRLEPRRARGVHAAVRRGPDLSRHLPGQLVPRAARRRDQRPGGGARARTPARLLRRSATCSMAADGYIPVATTRPETILGDTAVAVHPDDERYKRLCRPYGAACRSSTGRSR